MILNKKCVYALRAVFEIAKQQHKGVVTINAVAVAQNIPKRFLGTILNQLKQADILESRRGKLGGYLLARPAKQISVGEVVRFVNGPITPVDCTRNEWDKKCPMKNRCIFVPVWRDAEKALAGVLDNNNFADLLARDEEMNRSGNFSYSI